MGKVRKEDTTLRKDKEVNTGGKYISICKIMVCMAEKATENRTICLTKKL